MRRIFAAWWVWWAVFAASVVALLWVLISEESIADGVLMRAHQDVRQLGIAVEYFRQQEGRYPTETEGLAALVSSDVLRQLPKDPWGNVYAYRLTEGAPPFMVWSIGGDQRDDRGGGDDVATPAEVYSCAAYGCPGELAVPALLSLAFVSLVIGIARTVYSLYRWLVTKRDVSA